MSAELIVDRGIGNQSTALELVPSESADLTPITELYPQVNPMQLTRDDFLRLPDGNSRRDVLVSLRRNPYDSMQADQARTLFPEGFNTPLSDTEKKVFASMTRIIGADGGLISDRDMRVIGEHLQDIPMDQVMGALHEERANRRDGHFWSTRQEIGGYDLNRLIAFEAEMQAEIENMRDEARLHSLEDETRILEGRGFSLRETDIADMERLGEEYAERQRSREAYWQGEREKGYQSLRMH